VSCPLCRQRKGKRVCPAKGAVICSPCCGSKRRVEIECPPDCAFLGAHAGGWEGRQVERERDARRLAPYLERLSDAQGRLVLLALVGATAIRARRCDLDDRLLLDALGALRRTVATREKGILYEHAPTDARAHGLARELAELFEARDAEGARHAPTDRDLAEALGALEDALAATVAEGAGPNTFLDTATRLAGQLVGPPPARPRPLIVEP
jgi:hypothetical protein